MKKIKTFRGQICFAGTLVRQSQPDFPAGPVRAFGVLTYTRTLGEKVKV